MIGKYEYVVRKMVVEEKERRVIGAAHRPVGESVSMKCRAPKQQSTFLWSTAIKLPQCSMVCSVHVGEDCGGGGQCQCLTVMALRVSGKQETATRCSVPTARPGASGTAVFYGVVSCRKELGGGLSRAWVGGG